MLSRLEDFEPSHITFSHLSRKLLIYTRLLANPFIIHRGIFTTTVQDSLLAILIS